MHKPSWYKDKEILIINAKTCGINKDGYEQYIVDSKTGMRSDEINDSLADACDSICSGNYQRDDVSFCLEEFAIQADVFVPKYYDNSINNDILNLFKENNDFELKTLEVLFQDQVIEINRGHGSPSSDQRVGEIPYIKVSDLRAGSININPTNMIPVSLAETFWKSKSSGLKPYDLISPERASKNIGEFCVLMPGQEHIVLTKEVIVIRTGVNANFDQFYLMWALSLLVVRKQWERIVFMQTNREDVGKRMLEILIPYPKNSQIALSVSESFKKYYESLEAARNIFTEDLNNSNFKHHIHLESTE